MDPVEEQLALFEVDSLGQSASTSRPSRRNDVQLRQRSDRRAKPATELSTVDSLLSPEDVARRCGLSRKAVYRAVARGELRAARILSRLRIDPRDVEAWIRANVVDVNGPVPAPARARLPANTGLRRLLPEP